MNYLANAPLPKTMPAIVCHGPEELSHGIMDVRFISFCFTTITIATAKWKEAL